MNAMVRCEHGGSKLRERAHAKAALTLLAVRFHSSPMVLGLRVLCLSIVGIFSAAISLLAQERPEIEFHNQRDTELEIFWLPESGERKSVAKLPAGEMTVQSTTVGHRFAAEGEGFSQDVTARGGRQVVVFPSEEALKLRRKYSKVDGYTIEDVEGWTVLISDQLRADDPAAMELGLGLGLELLAVQCRRVVDAMVAAPDALKHLRSVPLWLSPAYEGSGMKAEYHPGSKWLADNGRHPLLVECVEFTNIPILDREVIRMPMLLLHELAHAYHHQVVTYEHPKLRAVFRQAVLKKSYDRVARKNGKPQKAYAMTNSQEYFAETSEAYFGQNDFYPFHRRELLEHDPDMFHLLAKLWEKREALVDPPETNFEVTAPPSDLAVGPFYKKYISARGYPIVSSETVNDYALHEAAWLVDLMLAKRPDVRDAMIHSGSRLIIMAHDEFTTDMPDHAHMKPKDFWDARARGLGGSRNDPVCSCAEENLLAFRGDPYAKENILIHEFAHNIHLRGMLRVDASFDDRLAEAYSSAMDEGLWAGKYAATNRAEYFAEGVQSWFDDNREDDHDHNHVNTRAELIEYDPRLATLCEEVFGDTELVYTKPGTRLTGHLEGYDPEESPEFVWPERLMKSREEIKKKARLRSDAAGKK